MLAKDTPGRCDSHPGGTTMAHSSLVGETAQNAVSRVNFHQKCTKSSSASSHGRVTSNEKTKTDGMHAVRRKLKKKKVSDRAVSVIMRSWRPSTQKQYNVYINMWNQFCASKTIDMKTAGIEVVLDFLVHLLDQGYSYSAINSARGALSAIVTPHTTDTVGNHPLVQRFMKGVFEIRPARPRYTQTWSVPKVLVYLKRLSPVKDLDLKQLTLKLTMLLSLTTAQRLQTLQFLDLKYLTRGATYKLSLGEKIKQSRPGKKELTVNLEPFPPDRRICVITVLKEYIERTKTE